MKSATSTKDSCANRVSRATWGANRHEDDAVEKVFQHGDNNQQNNNDDDDDNQLIQDERVISAYDELSRNDTSQSYRSTYLTVVKL